MTSWQTVSKKEFRDAVRSRRLVALVVVFVLFTVGGEYLVAELSTPSDRAATTDTLVSGLFVTNILLVPLVGLVSGYKTIAGERETGSYKLLLAQPHSRTDVVLGKLLGRGAVVCTGVLAGAFVGLGGAFLLVGGVDVVAYLTFYGLTLLYALAFLGLGVGISAATGSTSVAVGASLGSFVFFQFLWDFLLSLADQFLFASTHPSVLSALTRVSPLIAYSSAARDLVVGGAEADAAFYLRGEFAVLVLVLWAVVPLALGSLRFRSVDI